MKLWNKLLVRDGQAKLFSDEEITGEVEPERKPGQARQFSSPFRTGLQQLGEKVRDEKRGIKLPPEVEKAIMNKAAEVKEAA